jgi:hypothetical protein
MAWNWPCLLATQLTGESRIPRGAGIVGASWWSYRKELLKELNISPVKLLIICHTEPYRIPHDSNLPLNSSSVEGESRAFAPWIQSLPIPDLQEAGRAYYKYLHSDDFHNWCQLQWFRELNDIISDIPFVVHLPCFTQSIYPHIIGIRCATALFECRLVTDHMNHRRLVTANHMSADENQQLADILYNVITDYIANPNRDREFII